MRKNKKISKFFNLFLVFFMVISMINPVHIHAADSALKVTNSAGEECDTFNLGDPIYVEASEGSWIGLYGANEDTSSISSYYWCNAPTARMDILTGTNNRLVTAGEYKVVLFGDSGYTNITDTKYITISVQVDTNTSLSTDKIEYQYGETLKISAVNNTSGAWVGVYDGIQSEATDYSTKLMTALHHGRWYYTKDNPEYSYNNLPVGDYTVVLFKDGGYTVDKLVHITVKGTKLISTDKKVYYWGEEPINVTVVQREDASDTDWIGLYNVLETPSAATPSKYWEYASNVYGTHSLLDDYKKNKDIPGDSAIYMLYLLSNDGYEVIDYTRFTIYPGIVSVNEEQAPTCEVDGWQKVTLSDDSTATIGADRNPDLAATGHDYDELNDGKDDWVYDGAESRTHTKTCVNCNAECGCTNATVTENCTFDDGVVTKEPSYTEKGVMTYTCSECKGTYTEDIPTLDVVATGTERIKEPTCEEDGILRTYYSDGSHIDSPIIKLGHKYPETWTYDEATKSHSRVCANDSSHVEKEDCKFAKVTANGVHTFTCSVCDGSYTTYVMTADNTEYKYGDAINITIDYDCTSDAWVGLYKKGELPGEGEGTTVALYWDYVRNTGKAFNMVADSLKTEARGDEYIAGEYDIRLFDHGTYNTVAMVSVVVTTEIDESKTVKVEPTCETDGSITYTYTDGTTKKITAAEDEALKALGHAYPETWTYNEANKTHSKVCANDATHVQNGTCEFNEGVVTEEPTVEKDGVKTYTCKVCNGTYTETVSIGTVVSEEIVTPATCEKDGVKNVTYSTGKVVEGVVIPATGHKYPETWEYAGGESDKHYKQCTICANEENCECEHKVITEDCVYESSGVVNGKITYTCKVCNGSKEVVILGTDKTEYKYGEPIMVTTNRASHDISWVGIYKKGETYNPEAGGVKSIYWYYLNEVESNPIDIRTTRDENSRGSEFVAGEYTIVLFDEGTFYDATTTVNITVVADIDESKTVKVEPTCETDGSITYTYTDGTTKKITAAEDEALKALGHAYPETWTYNEANKTHSKVCANDATHVQNGTCEFNEGVVTEEPTVEKDGVKTYTCKVCNGTYTETVSIGTVVSEEIVTPATCEKDGVKNVTYSTGKVVEGVVIPATGHKYPETWTYDEATKSHSRVCANDANHVEKGNCEFDSVITNGVSVSTCKVCGGTHEVVILATNKAEYAMGEDIVVTINYPGNIENRTQWVGLYKRNDVPGQQYNESFYWNYLSALTLDGFVLNTSGNAATDAAFIRWPEYVAGDYKVVLFSSGGYDILATVDIVLTPAAEVSRVRTEPTCEKDGMIIITYADNTTKVIGVDEDETLKALGHTYGELVYNAKDKSHSKTCSACNESCGCVDAVVTDECTFDAGVVTKEPSYTETGIKTYTCSACKGTYNEELPKLGIEVVRTETIKEATCEEDGTLRTHYSDGSHIDTPITKLGHNYPETWTYDEATKTHSHICANDTSHKITENCVFTSSSIAMTTITFKCEVCGGTYTSEDNLVVNKTTFEYGEPIYVTGNFTGDGAWVGLYKKGESYNPEAGGVKSIFWYYLSEEDSTVNILDTRDENGRGGEYKAGDFKVVLFGDGEYSRVIEEIDIKVTSKVLNTVVTQPTCDKDGYKTTYYSDGSTLVEGIDVFPELKALGHKYGAWVFDEATKSHSHVCANDATHVEEAECTFGEAVVTKQPNGAEAGIKTYTCSVCKGTYTEEFYNDTVVSEQVTKAATCEEWGTKVVTYANGKTATINIPALGHKYPDAWTYLPASHQHTKVCAHDENHKQVEYCDYEKTGTNDKGETVYTCKVCQGVYTIKYLVVEDTDISIGEALNVTANCANDGSWVGLYAENDKYDPNRGGVVSFYWYYVVGDGHNRNGVEVNLFDFRNIERFDSLTTGTYKVVLFGDSGYSNVLSEVEVHITSQTDETEYGMKLNGKDVANKASVEFNEKEIQDVVVNVSADGVVGDSWVGIYYGKISGDGDASSVPTSDYWYWVDAKDGQENRNGVDVKLGDYIDLDAGDYTVVVYGDAGYSNVRHIAYFSIVKTAAFEEILMQPTCTDWGQKYVKYEDGTEELVPIEPLGHDVTGTLTFDPEHKEHYSVCSRCGEEVREECTFDNGGITGDGDVVYTCTVCGGQYVVTSKPEKPVIDKVNRVFGNTRYETSYEIANTMKELNNGETFDSIIVASGKNFADALAGSYLAAKKNAPILMTDGKNSTAIKTYIKNNVTAGGTVYVLGGTAAVSDKVLSGLTGYTVKRLDGKDRYATNLAILKEAGVTNEEIIIATGTGFADSLSASASGKPILLVGKKLSKEQKAFLASVQTKQYYVIGGTSAVSAALAKEVEAFGAVSRIGGKTRYETSVMVAEAFFNNATSAVVAYGRNYPDGLCGGPLAYTLRAPLILTENGKEADAVEYTSTRDIKVGMILGGSRLVSDKTTQKIFGLANANEIVVKK